jgi:hypothetical protein
MALDRLKLWFIFFLPKVVSTNIALPPLVFLYVWSGDAQQG